MKKYSSIFIGRRFINWSKARTPRGATALFFSTGGGAGLLPLAPGTWGTGVGIAVVWAIADWNSSARVLVWLALFVVGVWAAKVVDELMKTDDNQNTVMDEVVGVGITAWFAGRDPRALVAAFVLFRLFDVVKPWPVRWIDRMTKGRSPWVGGFGVMADDLGAGIQGLLVMMALRAVGWI